MTAPIPTEHLGAAVMGVLGSIQQVLPGGNGTGKATWLCGICGCLCFNGETCPKCRHDLFTRTARSTA